VKPLTIDALSRMISSFLDSLRVGIGSLRRRTRETGSDASGRGLCSFSIVCERVDELVLRGTIMLVEGLEVLVAIGGAFKSG
jgi:hypothetical protein